MNLQNYIDWTKTINDYEEAVHVASSESWGSQYIGRFKPPRLDITKNQEKGSEGYWHYRNDLLGKWASAVWPNLDFIEAKIQIQKPGQICHPHLDFLGEYLQHICEQRPELLSTAHSLNSPGIDVHRMFVAVDDQVPGQIFCINGKNWNWKAGDCIRLDNWQALHHTENNSTKDRAIIKITGVQF